MKFVRLRIIVVPFLLSVRSAGERHVKAFDQRISAQPWVAVMRKINRQPLHMRIIGAVTVVPTRNVDIVLEAFFKVE